ncbi:MAG: hypothetical protein CV045_12525 [Cyanobacteria bacterium M5B4]|nr:MAG: hypothetical protein CV045_12525 [Cyanobacteria bacterium M5B4]
MEAPQILTEGLRVLLSWEPHPYQVPPIKFSQNQVNLCTEFSESIKSVDSINISGVTPPEPYDIYEFVQNLGIDTKFDLVVVSISGMKRNLPYNVKNFDCPCVAIVTDTHHGYTSPLGELLTYLSLEEYDYICFPYCRQHMHWFYACGLNNLGWLPLLTMTTFPHHFLQERDDKVIFVCGSPIFHPYRHGIIKLLESFQDFEVCTLDRIKASQVYVKSLISLNCSLNGDLNLRNLEIISAGGFLLTDQISPQSGFNKLLEPGKDCDTYSSKEELVQKTSYYLNNPEVAIRIAKNAYAKFYNLLHPNYRINELYRWIVEGDAQSQFLADFDSRFEISKEFAELLETRVTIYEQVQELHRLQDSISILVEGDCEIIFAIDLVDLCRAKVFVCSQDERKIKTAEQAGVLNQISFTDNIDAVWDVYIFKSINPKVRSRFNIVLDESNQLVYSSLRGFSSLNRLQLKINDNETILISYFHDESAKYVIKEIFDNHCYQVLPFLGDINTIVDIGANVGFATAYFRSCYTKAKIYCFEPDPIAFLLLNDNCRVLGNCVAYPIGLYSDDVTKTIYLGESSVHSSIHQSSLASNAHTIDLKKADSFLLEHGITSIDIMKIDTEGCEIEILRRVMIHNFSIRVIYLEFHSEEDRRLIDQILSPNYLLWSASIIYGHRGSLCYLRRDLVPKIPGIESLQG